MEKTFKKEYRSSLDALGVSASRADDVVREATMAFLFNILIFEERDVAAGHLERIRTVEEVSELVNNNKAPLNFKKRMSSRLIRRQVSAHSFLDQPGAASQGNFHSMKAAVVCVLGLSFDFTTQNRRSYRIL